jgi:hypothetical protein
MILLIIAIIWLFAVAIPSLKYIFKSDNLKARLALVACYMALFAELWDVNRTASMAEAGLLPNGADGWLGVYWFPALVLLFMVITVLHLRFRIDGKKRNLSASK